VYIHEDDSNYSASRSDVRLRDADCAWRLCGGAIHGYRFTRGDRRQSRYRGKAGEYAPLELRQAQENLDAARQAMNDEEYEQAHRLAEAAREDARLAEVKAQSETAREQAREIQSTIETLRQEAEQRDPGR